MARLTVIRHCSVLGIDFETLGNLMVDEAQPTKTAEGGRRVQETPTKISVRQPRYWYGSSYWEAAHNGATNMRMSLGATVRSKRSQTSHQ